MVVAPTSGVPSLPAAAGAVPGQPGISIHPSKIVAPVGSEVVMLATACGGDGFMVTGERIEWLLSPDGVGQFVEPGQREPFDFMSLFTGLPRKVDNRYAVNRTLSGEMQIHRGTPSPADDITVLPGQAWISVTSPTEGTSSVTAYAPNVEGWDRRQQSATIYWVDAQAAFPPPGISPVGARHTFTTFLTRQSNGTPVANYRVRYEITGGPPAGFLPGGGTVAEVASNEAGQASVEIFQQQPSAGTNQIAIQVIRPQGVAPGGGGTLNVATGSTMQTWTSSDLIVPSDWTAAGRSRSNGDLSH